MASAINAVFVFISLIIIAFQMAQIISLSGAFIQPHLSLWCLHNPELAEHFDECHLGLHKCQPHANADSSSTPKWDEGTRVDGGLLGLAEPAAEGMKLACML